VRSAAGDAGSGDYKDVFVHALEIYSSGGRREFMQTHSLPGASVFESAPGSSDANSRRSFVGLQERVRVSSQALSGSRFLKVIPGRHRVSWPTVSRGISSWLRHRSKPVALIIGGDFLGLRFSVTNSIPS